MSWRDWFDLKIMDVLIDFYIVGAVIAILVICWFIASIIDLIKNK